MSSIEVAGYAVSGVACLGALWKAAIAGARSGASQTLNGTAEAVRRIEAAVLNVSGKLDQHVAQTGADFRGVRADIADLRDTAQDTRERLARMEGAADATPPRPRAKRRRAAR